MLDTRARARLAQIVKQRGQRWFAERIGITQGQVSRWVNGKSQPEHEHRVLMRRVAGIPEEWWFTDEQRAIAYRKVG